MTPFNISEVALKASTPRPPAAAARYSEGKSTPLAELAALTPRPAGSAPLHSESCAMGGSGGTGKSGRMKTKNGGCPNYDL